MAYPKRAAQQELKKEKIPFTQVSDDVLKDSKLTMRAKGIYAYAFSKPEGWEFSASRIVKDCEDGKKSILAGLKELEGAGYLERKRLSSGKVIYQFNLRKPESPKGFRASLPDRPKGSEPKRQQAQKAPISNTDKESKTEEENKREKKKDLFSFDVNERLKIAKEDGYDQVALLFDTALMAKYGLENDHGLVAVEGWSP